MQTYKFRLVDMFGQTSRRGDKFGQTRKGDFDIHNVHSCHVECVCLLDKKKPKGYVEIGVDAEDYYRIKDSKEER